MRDNEWTAVAQRGLTNKQWGGVAKAEAQQAALRLEGAADVNEELAEIGLSAKTGWYASILLYGVGGVVTVLLGLLRPDMVPTGVTILGGFAILLSVLSAVGSRYLTNADWATHLRLGLGLSIFLIGAVVAGDLRLAFIMLPLFVLITPTFLYGARFATPYVLAVTATILIVMLATPGPARTAHAILTTGAMLMIVISFMFAEHRTRSLARTNRKLAFTDALTGIANTRRLRERLTDALGKPFGDGQPFVLFAIDLDNFKVVNDTFDHSTGDRVLCAVAKALDEEVRFDDLVARRGGDEFSVLITSPNEVDLDELTMRLERAIERARLATCPQITPSGSVAYVESLEGDSIASVLQRADDELHTRKLAFHASETGPARRNLDTDAPSSSKRGRDRDTAIHSVAAAVNRAYAARKISHRERFNAFVGRVQHESSRLDPIWVFVGLMNLSIGVTLTILSAVDLLSPLPREIGMLCGLGLVAIGVLCFRGSSRAARKQLIFPSFMLSIGLATIAIAAAGDAGTAMLDIYVVLALYGFYFVSTRSALVLLAICSALLIGFAVGGSYPDGGVRAAVTVSVLFAATAVVIKVRSVTLRFVRTNRELSEVDALTGVANLRALKLRVGSAMAAADPTSLVRRPILLTVDLDRFKQVNDRYNHTVGDQVLKSVARAISETVRVDELVSRRGGDEFFVLFANETPEHIESVIPRLADAVAHARLRICPDLVPTASIGFVSWKAGDTLDDFMHRADTVMHDEKIETRERDYSALGT